MIDTAYWKRILRYTLRTYFAPITGAFKCIRNEYRRIDAEAAASRKAEQDARASQRSSVPRD